MAERELKLVYCQRFSKEIIDGNVVESLLSRLEVNTGSRFTHFVDDDGRLNIVPITPSPPLLVSSDMGRILARIEASKSESPW